MIQKQLNLIGIGSYWVNHIAIVSTGITIASNSKGDKPPLSEATTNRLGTNMWPPIYIEATLNSHCIYVISNMQREGGQTTTLHKPPKKNLSH